MIEDLQQSQKRGFQELIEDLFFYQALPAACRDFLHNPGKRENPTFLIK